MDRMTRRAGLAAELSGRRVVICAGPGGVGKTTTAAAVALGMAAQGLRVAVVTIDPARRLADALGIEQLDDQPRRVDPERLAGREMAGSGELWAMTLDAKRTFDALIDRVAPDERTRDEVLSNRIYQELSTAVAGSQEFMAIAKLYELDAEGDYDLVVLDTPPSRNALDFLDAPGRLISFFQGRAIRLFLRPAGFGRRLVEAGSGAAFAVMKRATGVDLLRDLSEFFSALTGLADGFTDRARHVEALLGDPATTFVVVTSAEQAQREEAVFLMRRLTAAGMSFGALVINRVHREDGLPSALPADLAAELGSDLSARVLAVAQQRARVAARDREGLALLRAHAPDTPRFVVPELGEDVHDVAGLMRLADLML